MGISRRLGWLAAALTTATVAAILVPGTAHAVVPIGDGPIIRSSVPDTYSFSGDRGAWMVVGVQPAAGTDYDLTIRKTNGPVMRTSTKGTNLTDFVGLNFNSGFVPFGPYQALVAQYSGIGTYSVQRRWAKTSVIPQPAYNGVTGPSDPDIFIVSLSNDQVFSVYEFWMFAGDQFWANNRDAGNLWLLESDPNDPNAPITHYASRREADRSRHQPVDGCTLYTASYSGWQAIVVAADRTPTAPGAGIGFALHRHIPGRPPGYCPIKNFPGNTPPGVYTSAG